MGCSAVPEHVQRLPVERAALEPAVGRPPLHGNAVQIIGRVQHLNHGLNMHHLLAQPFGLLPVVQYLAAQLGMKPL
jgi:hypothetical protein